MSWSLANKKCQLHLSEELTGVVFVWQRLVDAASDGRSIGPPFKLCSHRLPLWQIRWGFLRQIMTNAAADRRVLVFAGELIGIAG
jgi:hypothetical protein